MATAKAVAAGNSCRQEDIIAAANMGRKAIADLLRVCKVRRLFIYFLCDIVSYLFIFYVISSVIYLFRIFAIYTGLQAYDAILRIFMIFADSNLQSFHALYSNCCQFAVTPAMFREHKSK